MSRVQEGFATIGFYGKTTEEGSKSTASLRDLSQTTQTMIRPVHEREEQDQEEGERLLKEGEKILEQMRKLLRLMKKGQAPEDAEDQIAELGARKDEIAGQIKTLKSKHKEGSSGVSYGTMGELMKVMRELQDTYVKLQKRSYELAAAQNKASFVLITSAADAKKDAGLQQANKDYANMSNAIVNGVTSLGSGAYSLHSAGIAAKANKPLEEHKADLKDHKEAVMNPKTEVVIGPKDDGLLKACSDANKDATKAQRQKLEKGQILNKETETLMVVENGTPRKRSVSGIKLANEAACHMEHSERLNAAKSFDKQINTTETEISTNWSLHRNRMDNANVVKTALDATVGAFKSGFEAKFDTEIASDNYVETLAADSAQKNQALIAAAQDAGQKNLEQANAIAERDLDALRRTLQVN